MQAVYEIFKVGVHSVSAMRQHWRYSCLVRLQGVGRPRTCIFRARRHAWVLGSTHGIWRTGRRGERPSNSRLAEDKCAKFLTESRARLRTKSAKSRSWSNVREISGPCKPILPTHGVPLALFLSFLVSTSSRARSTSRASPTQPRHTRRPQDPYRYSSSYVLFFVFFRRLQGSPTHLLRLLSRLRLRLRRHAGLRRPGDGHIPRRRRRAKVQHGFSLSSFSLPSFALAVVFTASARRARGAPAAIQPWRAAWTPISGRPLFGQWARHRLPLLGWSSDSWLVLR
jgi:hypothetical protein